MIIIILMLLISSNAWCSILNVPTDYPSVQQALNAAGEHDTVLVADGLYYENLIFPPVNLTLASQFLMDGDSTHLRNTILDGSRPINTDSSSVLFMEGFQDSTTVVSGFTIRRGHGTFNNIWYPDAFWYGGGCLILNASPVIRYNHITEDTAESGGALYLRKNGDVVVEGNEIWNNHTVSSGTIRMDSCSARIIGNQIHHNSGFQCTGLASWFCNNIFIVDNYIHHNTADDKVAGALAGGTYVITGNVISDHYLVNSQLGFGSGFTIGYANLTLTNNQFLRNTHGMMYGALWLCEYCVGTVSDNLFQDNSSVWNGAGIMAWGATCTISNNQFIGNYDSLGGALYVGLNAFVDLHNNTFTGNTNSAFRGSAIYTRMNAIFEPHDNNFYGNASPAVSSAPDSPNQSINAINNWWGDPSGPYNPTLNPHGLGDEVGNGVIFDPWLTQTVGVMPQPIAQASTFHLFSPRPNPFNAMTCLRYSLPVMIQVNLSVWDVSGRCVAVLVNGRQTPGEHQITFDGSSLPSGLYLYRLTAGMNSATGKMVLLK